MTDEEKAAKEAADAQAAEKAGATMTAAEKFTANMPVSVLKGENKQPIIQTTVVY